MKSLARLVLGLAGLALIMLGLATFVLEGALLFGWDVWPLVGPTITAVAHVDHAKWMLPVVALFLIRGGAFFLQFQDDLA